MSKKTKEMHPEGRGVVYRRAFLRMFAGAAAGAAVAAGMPETAAAEARGLSPMPTKRSSSHSRGGHLYMQTNESRNAIIHYRWAASGELTEVERVATGGAGSGLLSPIYHTNRPNHFEGAGSVIVTRDRRFLFTTNGGDNSVSSFALNNEGRVTLLDVKPTGNPTNGGAKSLTHAPSSSTLFVVHTFGPDHLRLMSVDAKGKLTARPESYSVSTRDWPNRVPTMAVFSPDGTFLVLGSAFDELPSRKNPDGSLILWIPRPDGTLHVIASNAPDPDGLVVFPVGGDGTLGTPSLYDARGASPFYIAFLHNRPDTFIIGYAVSDGLAIGRIDADGKINVISPLVQIDTSEGLPSELCWLAVSPDDRFVFTTNFGYSTVSSYRIDGNVLSIAKDPAGPKVPGDGKFRAINGTVSSGPSDSWLTPDGACLYQIYGNASKLVGYATRPDGSLEQITSVKIPYNSPQGLAGF
jgi:6-phosphogluconolactonase (cycloisomerase 2 family)